MKKLFAIGTNNYIKVAVNNHIIELIKLDNCYQYRVDSDPDNVGFITSLKEVKDLVRR